jgi:hypothetical protein
MLKPGRDPRVERALRARIFADFVFKSVAIFAFFNALKSRGNNNLNSAKSTLLCKKAILVIALLLIPGSVLLVGFKDAPKATALAITGKTLNFQGRLLSNTGALVADGYYNIEFKLYNDPSSSGSSQGSCTGDANCVWTETRYDTNGVTAGNDYRIRVTNGYFSVVLGDSTNGGTAFASTIDWSQQLYLTMRVGGLTQTATPTWDTEMTPRIQTTAVPLAFMANNVNSGNTYAASTNSKDTTIQSGNATGATSNSGNVIIDAGTATGTKGSITIGIANAAAITLGRTGLTTSNPGSLSVGQTLTVNGSLLGAGASTGTATYSTTAAQTNTTSITVNSATGFAVNDVIFINNAGQDYYTRITNIAGLVFTVSPAVSVDAVSGSTPAVTKYTVQSIGATPTDYTTLNNRFFQGYFLGGIVTGAGSTTYSDARIQSTNALNINATSTVIQNTADSTTSLQVQNVAGSNILSVDTANAGVKVGSAATQALFNTKADYTTGSNPRGLNYADLDKDGDTDVVVANSGTNNVSVFLNNGSGTFAAKADYTVGSGPSSVSIGDLDGDGDLDLAVTNLSSTGSNGLSILFNGGAGTFSGLASYSTGSGPSSVALLDIDKDGDLDFAVTNSNSTGTNAISVLLNNGAGVPGAASPYNGGSGPLSIVAADFDKDGDADIAVANSNSTGSSGMSIFVNAAGTLTGPTNYTTGSGPTSLVSGDFDKDGDIDIAVENQTSSTVSVFLNTGAGSFAAKVDYTTDAGPVWIATGDINKDGYLDLITANRTNNNTSVLMGMGSGMFGAKTDYPTGTDPRSVIVADLDKDGDADVVSSNNTTTNISVFINRIFGVSPTTNPTLQVNSLAGNDALQITGTGPNNQFLRVDSVGNTTIGGSASGLFDTKVDYSNIGMTNPNAIATADVNKDGAVDIIASNNNGSVTVFYNNGSGVYGKSNTYTMCGGSPVNSEGITTGDFNKDGAIDFATVCGGVAALYMGMNNGDGTFNTTNGYTLAFSGSFNNLVSADFNKDGKLDIATIRSGSNELNVLINSGLGAGQFGATSTPTTMVIYTTGSGANNLATGDFNGDGRPDLAVANGSSTTMSVFLNTGAGSGQFGASPPAAASKVDYTVGTSPGAMAAGDFDEDGDLDIAVVYNSSLVRIMTNSGTGTFSSGAGLTGVVYPDVIQAGDINKDGNLDLVTANDDANTLSVFTGVGNGTFNTKLDYATGTRAAGLALADLDNDGDIDATTGNMLSSNMSVFLSTAISNNRLQVVSENGSIVLAVDTKTSTVRLSNLNNTGSTLNTAKALSDYPSGGAIGTAAATVDNYTTFTIPQSTASQALTLPNPTNTTAGRIVYILNTGSVSFTMHGVTIVPNGNTSFIWNGSAWSSTSGGANIQLDQAHAYKSTSTAIATVTAANLALDIERFDNNNIHSTVTNPSRFTIQKGGTYTITGGVGLSAPLANGFVQVGILKNGATYLAISNIGVGSYQTTVTTGAVNLTAGDYLEFQVYNGSTGSITPFSANEWSQYMTINQVPDYMGGGSGGSGYSGAEVYNNANLTNILVNATYTSLTFNSERQDTSNYHSTSSNTSRLVAPVSGMYYIHGSAYLGTSTAGTSRSIGFLKNNSVFISTDNKPGNAGGTHLSSGTQTYLNAGDYMEMQIYQDTGSTMTVNYQADYSPNFGMSLLSSSGGGGTLQSDYDAGNTIATTNARDISFTLADTATDANLVVNIAGSSSGLFAVQGAGVNAFTVNGAGQALFKNISNSTSALRVQNLAGNNVFSVDTTAGSAVLGTASALAGKLTLQNATNANTVSLTSGVTTSSYTLTLPVTLGTTGQCLKLADGVGTLTFSDCGSSSGGGSGGGTVPTVRATPTATSSYTSSGAWVSTALAAESFDTDLMHDNTTNNSRVTFNTAGKYQINANLVFSANTSGSRYVRIILNGATVIGEQSTPAATTSGALTRLAVSKLYQFNAGDYIEMQGWQDSGSTLTSDTAITDLSAVKVDGGGGSGSSTGGSASYAKATMTTSSSYMTNNTNIAVPFASEDQDTDNYHSNVTNNSRFTAPSSGFYSFKAEVGFDFNSTGVRRIYFAKNGTGTYGTQSYVATATYDIYATTSTDLYLNVGDYVELMVFQNSGSALGHDSVAEFSVFKINGGSGGSSSAGGTQLDQARIYKTTTTAVTAANGANIAFDAERFDNDNLHSTSTNTSRYTIAHSGIYSISGHLQTSAGTTAANVYASVLVNGANVIARQNFPNGGDEISISTSAVYFNAGDYLELRLSNGSGSTVTLAASTASAQDGQEFVIAQLPDSYGTGSGNGSAYNGVEVYNNANLTNLLVNNAYTTITFNSERQDTSNYHDSTTNTSRLVAPVSGMYYVHGAVSLGTNSTGTRSIAFWKNGTTFVGADSRPASSTLNLLAGSSQIYLNAGDYLELQVFQDSGSAMTVSYNADFSPLFGMSLLNGSAGVGSATTGTSGGGASFVSLNHNTTQGMVNNTVQAVVFNTELQDTDGYHDTSSNTSRVTVPTSGLYSISGNVRWPTNATGARDIYFRVNGAGTFYGETDVAALASNDTITSSTTSIYLNAGDYLELMGYQNSGGTLTLASSTTNGAPTLVVTKINGGSGGSSASGAGSQLDQARVYNNANSSTILTSTNYTMLFNSERYDNNNLHSTSSNTDRFTIAHSGYYQITANAGLTAVSPGNRVVLGIARNGTETIAANDMAVGAANVSVTATYYFNAGDYVSAVIANGTGSSITLTSSASGGSQQYGQEFSISQVPDSAAGGISLQSAYNIGNTITSTDGRDLTITLADTTTDANLIVNVVSGSTSRFAVQYAGVDTFSISNAASAQGSALFKNVVNNTSAFQIQNATGTSIFNVDTTVNSASINGATNNVTLGFLTNGTAGTMIGVSNNAGGVINGSAVGDLMFRTNSKDVLVSTNAGSNSSLIVKASGNVGVGNISDPQNTLHVYNNTSTVGGTQVTLEGTTAGYGAGIDFISKLNGGARMSMAKITADGTNSWNTTGSTQDAALRFFTTDNGTQAERLRITSDGQLTMGTAGTMGSVGALSLTTGGSSPINNRLTFGTDGSGWKFAIAKNQGGTVSDLLTVSDSGATTVNGTLFVTNMSAASTYTSMCWNSTTKEVTYVNNQTCAFFSDERLKTNVTTIGNALDKLSLLRGVTFDWQDPSVFNSDEQVGVIAQDVLNAFPQLVRTGRVAHNGVEGDYYTVNTLGLVGPTIQAVNELNQIVKDTNLQVQNINTRLGAVEAGHFGGNITAVGNVSVGGDLTVQGVTTLKDLVVQGDTTVQQLTINGKIITGGDVPGVALGAAAGSTLTAVGTVTGNDTAGTLSITTGVTGTVADDVLGEVTFHTPYTQTPTITVTATSEEAANIRFFLIKTTTGWSIKVLDVPLANKTYSFDYHVIQ